MTDSAGLYTRTLAENIVGLVIMPMSAGSERREGTSTDLAPSYTYDSRSGSDDPNDSSSTLHLLPPLLRVTIIAFDQETLTRIGLDSNPPEIIKSNYFNRSLNYDTDIKAMEEEFIEERYGYRIFTTVFPMRAGRWSSSSSS